MKFVALISGGKDSFFNIYHCLSQGHERVALCNLYPEASGVDEMDSFMFQTVGHEVIAHYSECLQVPLYRQPIVGKSSNQNLEYSLTQDDEIEDLYQLLSSTLRQHPEVQAVSCGAILSHYQRTRVENVCSRLNLTSLCYLWQRNQYDLMREMCQYGLDARLIKVAAIGLNSSHLGKSIQQMLPHLVKLNKMYEVHVCGEGGEFETIVLDAPFFKKKLNVVDSKVVQLSNDDVCYMKLKVELVDKQPEQFVAIASPPLLDRHFHEISAFDEVETAAVLATVEATVEAVPGPGTEREIKTEAPSSILEHHTCIVNTPSKLYISNLTSSKDTLSSQTIDIFDQLNAIITDHKLSFDHIQAVTLLLSDMANFEQVNAIYSKQFSQFFLPPSRICISTNLATEIQLSCIVLKPQTQASKTKSGIHIRSRSYWAPHNIGPYSQAIIDENEKYKLATISGQIPLDPSSMEFTNKGFKFDTLFSLQHFHRIKELIDVNQIDLMTCFVTSDALVPVITNVWRHYSDSNHLLVIVTVKTLPRNALVEWGGSTFETKKDMYEDSDDEEEDHEYLSVIKSFQSHHYTNINNSLLSATLFTNNLEKLERLKQANKGSNYIQVITSEPHGLGSDFEVLPVESVFNSKGKQFKFAIRWKIENFAAK